MINFDMYHKSMEYQEFYVSQIEAKFVIEICSWGLEKLCFIHFPTIINLALSQTKIEKCRHGDM